MPRNPRQSKQTNQIDPDLAIAYVSRIEHLNDNLETKRSAYIANCKVVREDIKEVLAEAKGDGIPIKALKATVKDHQLDRKKIKLAASLDIDDGVAFEQIKEALGEYGSTPLGKAAIDAAKPGPDIGEVTTAEDTAGAAYVEEPVGRLMLII